MPNSTTEIQHSKSDGRIGYRRFWAPCATHMTESTKIAIDLAKRVFPVHFVDPEIGAIRNKTPESAKLIPFFTNCPRSRVAMEMDRADKQSLRPPYGPIPEWTILLLPLHSGGCCEPLIVVARHLLAFLAVCTDTADVRHKHTWLTWHIGTEVP